MLAHQDKVDVLDVIRKSAQIISKTDDAVQIMDNRSYDTHDAKCSDELKEELNEGDEVIFVDIDSNVEILEKS